MSGLRKPALSAAEWAEALQWPHGVPDYMVARTDYFGYGDNSLNDRHALAALALHDLTDDTGRSLGFTRAHLLTLRSLAAFSRLHDLRRVTADRREFQADTAAADELIAIFEALLPPEGP